MTAPRPLEIERIGPFEYARMQPVLPALVDGREARRHPVVILGGGPVGLATALGLANHGVPSVVLEADDTVCMGSRAACVSRRSLEIIERLGALDAFLAKGLPWTTGRSYWRTTEVFRFEMPHDAAQKLPPMVNLQQYYIEQYLLDEIGRRNAARPGLIAVRWANEATAMAPRADGVALAVGTPKGSYRLEADWLVACDGGQSFARKTLGLPLHGTAFEGRYAIVDIELHSAHPTERRAWFDPPWNPGSTVLMHRQPDDLWRVDYQVRADQDTADTLSPERVHAFVQRHLDAIGEGHLPWKPVWTSVYRAGAMTLESYRHGRVLFAGNAAHAMPIFGVRGLNSGFDDADNLAWKLACVLRGAAGEALLDSYSRERIQAFHVNAASARRSTEFMAPPSRGFELMREAALQLAGAHPAIAQLVNPRQTSAIAYEASPLSTDSDTFAAGPVPGAPLAEQPLADGRHLTDRLARGAFTALVFAPDARPGAALEAALSHAAQSAPLEVTAVSTQEAAAAAYGAEQGGVYLVRPDGHVAGRWHAPTAQDLAAALERALCRG